MLEITNPNRFQVQVLIRSRKTVRSFTTLNVPGIGGGKNVVLIEDERKTEYVDRLAKMKLIKTRHIPNKQAKGA